MSKKELRKILIDKINNSYWWHVPPEDPDAYKKRGKYLASTYAQAEFYGRPNIEPERVNITKPVFDFSEDGILKQLFPKKHKKLSLSKDVTDGLDYYGQRIELDRKMCEMARKNGHDAIVLLNPAGRQCLKRNRKPDSIELNLLNIY